MNWSPNRAAAMSVMMPQMPQMMPPMGYSGAQFMPMPAFDAMHTTLTPSAGGPWLHQPSMHESIATGMTATSSHKSLFSAVNEETDKKQKARIELLEKKIKAKDQLFEDALSTTVNNACGHVSENKSLTSELKRRFLKLKTKYAEAETEI